jgi:hypothetical protein
MGKPCESGREVNSAAYGGREAYVEEVAMGHAFISNVTAG